LLHTHIAARTTSTISDRPRGGTRFGWIAGLAITGSLIGSLLATPTAGATTSPVATPKAAALTTTTIDKPWYSVERYYVGLLTCTGTGGWVLSDGPCRGYGSGHYSAYVAPITYTYGISDKVSRPYAKLIAIKAMCSHSANGDPGYRLRRVGYTRWNWGENIGCRDGYESGKSAVLASHLAMQAERSSNGGHWKNMKNKTYRWVGIGVWRYGVRTRLVIDFYG